MNLDESSTENGRAAATQAKTMNSAEAHSTRGVQVNGPLPHKCVICGDPTGERCFCRIHRKDGELIMLCCPDCTVQYLDSSRAPTDDREQELRAYQKSTYFFIGENKPWS